MSPLAEITYRGFRNLADGSWRPGPGGHLLVGPNGAGKTSLLEAVYLLATSKSFRAPRIADCRRHGADGLTLFGRVDGEQRAELELAWSGTDGVARRLNGKSAALADYLAPLSVVAWSAASGRLIDGVPEIRRRFLDQGVVGVRPAALAVLSRYRRALDQKRRLLKTGAGGRDALAAWNQVLAESAGRLIELRRDYVDELETAFAAIIEASDLRLPDLELRYQPSPAVEPPRLGAVLDEVAARELEAGQPLIGPHRDELKLLWGGHEVRRVSSAGERKAFGLLLTAARARVLTARGRPPILLLDDLDAELDDARLERLWSVFARSPQVVATSTREDLARRLGGLTRWRLAGGALEGPQTPLNDSLNG